MTVVSSLQLTRRFNVEGSMTDPDGGVARFENSQNVKMSLRKTIINGYFDRYAFSATGLPRLICRRLTLLQKVFPCESG
jgi:hypothetical protein